jgi:hypothetical protein
LRIYQLGEGESSSPAGPELEPGPRPEPLLSLGMKAMISISGAVLVALLIVWYFSR